MNPFDIWEKQYSWFEEEVFKISLNKPLSESDKRKANELLGRIASLKREILKYEQT